MVSKKFEELPEIKRRNVEWQNMSEEDQAELRLKNPLDWANYRYYRLIDENSKDFKEMDWDSFKVKFDAERATWGEELVARFDAYRSELNRENHASEVTRYYEAMKTLNEAGYWENDALNNQVLVWHEKMPKKADGTGLLQEWQAWLDAGSEEKRRIEKTSFYKSTIRILEANRSKLRYNILLSNPELDRMVIEWFGRVPVHQQNMQFYMELYKLPPSRLSSPMGVGVPRASKQLPR